MFFFLDLSPRVMKIETKVNKWELIKLQCFCTAEEIINNQQATYGQGENIYK